MWKCLATLFRGTAADAAGRLAETGAHVLLAQQVRDCAASLADARKQLALVMAHGAAESRRLALLDAQAGDLEQRIRSALASGRDDLARAGAEALATLENDRAANNASAAAFERAIATLRATVSQTETRLADLERGRRLAAAERRIADARHGAAQGSRASLGEAEATLAGIKRRAAIDHDREAASLALEATGADAAAHLLAAAGFGPKLQIDADDILQRLRPGLPSPVPLNKSL